MNLYLVVSTHSRPKAAGSGNTYKVYRHQYVSTHSRPKAAGAFISSFHCLGLFQHTAARRRLEYVVSTHSRPKAAGNILLCQPISLAFQHTAARRRLDVRQSLLILHCFNTQPPEGGWLTDDGLEGMSRVFQHTAARRRLVFYSYRFITCMDVSTHSRPKAAGSMSF